MIERKRLLIVEPSSIITEGLTVILKESAKFDILSPAADVENLPSRLASAHPDILLINPTLLPPSKRPALTATMQEYPQLAVMALVYQYVEPPYLRLFHGMVDIREERKRISDVILECCAALIASETVEDNSYELTNRETDVLILIAKGLMNKEIAERLTISIHTVISHRKNITRKTNIKSVAGLAMYALMNNLVEEGAI